MRGRNILPVALEEKMSGELAVHGAVKESARHRSRHLLHKLPFLSVYHNVEYASVGERHIRVSVWGNGCGILSR